MRRRKSGFFSLYLINQTDAIRVHGGILSAAEKGFDNVCVYASAFVTWNQNIETDLSNARSYVTKTIAPFHHHLSFFRKGIFRIALKRKPNEYRIGRKSNVDSLNAHN